MARSEWTSVSESSKDWAGTSTSSLTPTSQLESCSEILRVFRERVQCQSGSTKRNPKRVRVHLSRTSRTDEAAERCRLHGRRPLSLEAARDGACCASIFAQVNANLLRKHAQNDAFGHPTRAGALCALVVPQLLPRAGRPAARDARARPRWPDEPVSSRTYDIVVSSRPVKPLNSCYFLRVGSA